MSNSKGTRRRPDARSERDHSRATLLPPHLLAWPQPLLRAKCGPDPSFLGFLTTSATDQGRGRPSLITRTWARTDTTTRAAGYEQPRRLRGRAAEAAPLPSLVSARGASGGGATDARGGVTRCLARVQCRTAGHLRRYPARHLRWATPLAPSLVSAFSLVACGSLGLRTFASRCGWSRRRRAPLISGDRPEKTRKGRLRSAFGSPGRLGSCVRCGGGEAARPWFRRAPEKPPDLRHDPLELLV